MLVLKADESFPCEMGKIESIGVVLSKLLTKIHVLLIQKLNLVRIVIQAPL